MKIEALDINNFKRLKDVRIVPGPTLVIVTGRNGQGKTSVLDAIECGLIGKKAAPGTPIRKGKEEASIRIDLGEFVVVRKFREGMRDYLRIENTDGSECKGGQALLDSFYSKVTFDPVEFSRQDSKTQAKTLRRLAGLDEKFAALALKEETIRGDRHAVNRDARDAEAAARALPPGEDFDGVPDHETDPSDVIEELNAALARAEENWGVRELARKAYDTYLQTIESTRIAFDRVEQIKALLEKAEADYEAATVAEENFQQKAAETSDTAMALEEPDTEAIKDRLKGLDESNRRVRRKMERAEAYRKWDKAKMRSDDLTEQLTNLDAERSALLAEARYPVEGLDVRGEDEVFYNRIPFDQASESERIKVGLAIGGALNPKFRVPLIRGGSFLDDDSLKVVEEWAETNGFQVWVEIVGGPDADEGIVIEDGEVIATKPTKARGKARPKGEPDKGAETPGPPPPIKPLTPEDSIRQAGELF